jgi:hypothetical protein
VTVACLGHTQIVTVVCLGHTEIVTVVCLGHTQIVTVACLQDLCYCKSVQLLPAVQQIAAFLQHFEWECLEHLAYGPNLAPSYFIL